MRFDHRKTLIIPVTKLKRALEEDDLYRISVTSPLWNQLQVLLLEGGDSKSQTIEFDIQEEDETNIS